MNERQPSQSVHTGYRNALRVAPDLNVAFVVPCLKLCLLLNCNAAAPERGLGTPVHASGGWTQAETFRDMFARTKHQNGNQLQNCLKVVLRASK